MAIYSDLNPINPYTKGTLVEGLSSVDAAILNILDTRKRQAPFEPELGVDLEDYLFELLTDDTASALYGAIFTTLNRWEPRIEFNHQLSSVTVNSKEDGYDVLLAYSVKGYGGTRGMSFFLKRLLRS